MAKKNIATFLGAQPGLSVAGNLVYAYSGAVSVDNTETDLLLFTTGNETIEAIFRPCYLQSTGDDYEYRVYFNGVLIAYTKATSEATIPAQKHFELIIPPRTTVQVTGDNTESSSSANIGALITGRIHK
jgi:hypothetical protein